MSFHNAKSIRGDLPNGPIETHTGYMQKGGAYVIEMSKVSIRHKVPITGRSPGGEAGLCLKPGGCSGGMSPGE